MIIYSLDDSVTISFHFIFTWLFIHSHGPLLCCVFVHTIGIVRYTEIKTSETARKCLGPQLKNVNRKPSGVRK